MKKLLAALLLLVIPAPVLADGTTVFPGLYQTCGTWTPSDVSGASLTLTVTSANYCKTGRAVTYQMDITYPSTASSATNMISLPFAPLAVNQGAVSVTSSLALTMEVLLTGGNQVFVSKASSGAEANSTLSLGVFRVQGTYISST